MKPSITRVVAAGLLATLVMTAVAVYVAPMMGIAPMNPATMLAGQMGGVVILGWAAHLMIGVALAFIYVGAARSRLPGPAALRGALFSLAPWLVAQIVVMPMMGMGLFSGSMTLAGGSLIGHLVYGTVLGAVTGAPASDTAAETAHLRTVASH